MILKKACEVADYFVTLHCQRETAYCSWRNGMLLPEKRPVAMRQTG